MNQTYFNRLLAIMAIAIFAGCAATEVPLPTQLGQSESETESSDKTKTHFASTSTSISKSSSTTKTMSGNHEAVSQAKPATKPVAQPVLVELGAKDDLLQLINASPGKVLIDFHADWCGPCKKQGVILQNMKTFASANKARMIKINIDDHQQLAKIFRVASIPTLLVVKDGKVVERHLGLANRKTVESLIKQ